MPSGDHVLQQKRATFQKDKALLSIGLEKLQVTRDEAWQRVWVALSDGTAVERLRMLIDVWERADTAYKTAAHKWERVPDAIYGDNGANNQWR